MMRGEWRKRYVRCSTDPALVMTYVYRLAPSASSTGTLPLPTLGL